MENSEKKKKISFEEFKKKFELKPIKKANVGKRVMFLILNTNNIGEFYYGRVEDGFFEKGENTWFVGAQQPILVKDMFGFTPLFILRYDSPFPSENVHPIVPEFLKELPEDERNKLPTPRLLQRLLKMVILANVIKPKRRIKLDFKKLIIILIISFAIYYLFFMAR